MAETRALKLCTKGDILSLAKGMTNHPEKGRSFAHVTPLLYAQLWTRNNSPRLSVSCYQQCRARRTTAYRTYGP